MKPREISKKKYEAALKAYQEQIVQIAILEYELRDLSGKKAKKDAYDTLKDKVIKFRSQREAAIALGVSRPTISKNTDKGTLVLKRYKFTSKEPKKDKLRGINKC